MSPVRIVILSVLFYLLYRLIFGRKKVKPTPPPVTERPASGDVLVQDPFCHTYIPKKQAIQAIKDGEKLYFCSDKCCQAFLNDKAQDSEKGHKKGDKP